MRVMLKVEIPVEVGNEAVREGTYETTIQAILEEQKPEAAYFAVSGGDRTAFVVLNLKSEAQLAAICEPWFLAFEGAVEVTPVMSAKDLSAAADAMSQAADNW